MLFCLCLLLFRILSLFTVCEYSKSSQLGNLHSAVIPFMIMWNHRCEDLSLWIAYMLPTS